MADEDLIVPSPTIFPFSEAQETHHAFWYHSFEFVSVDSYLKEGYLSAEIVKRRAYGRPVFQGRQYEPETGMRKHGDGIVAPIEVKSQNIPFGLGFQPTPHNIKEMIAKKKRKKICERKQPDFLHALTVPTYL